MTQNRWPKPQPANVGVTKCVLMSTYGSPEYVEPMMGVTVKLRALGAEVRVCAPPDGDAANPVARVGVPMAPVGQFDAVTEVAAAAVGCDAMVATGMLLSTRSADKGRAVRTEDWPHAPPSFD